MKIPEEALPGLKAILALDATSFNALAAACRNTIPSLTPEGLSKRVSKQVAGVPSADISSILETVCGLYWIKFEGEASPHDLSVSVSDAAAEMLPKDEPLTVEQKSILSNRLEQLLLLDKSLGVTDSLEAEFHSLVNRWKMETFYLSSLTKKYAHPAYQRIIAMGTD